MYPFLGEYVVSRTHHQPNAPIYLALEHILTVSGSCPHLDMISH